MPAVDTAAAGSRPLGPEASTTTAADLSDISKPAPIAEAAQAAAGDILGTGIVAAGDGCRLDAGAGDGRSGRRTPRRWRRSRCPSRRWTLPRSRPSRCQRRSRVFEEPAYEPAPEPTQFEASMAAADEVEASVDDMFADIA